MSIYEFDEKKYREAMLEEGREEGREEERASLTQNLQKCYEEGLISAEALRKIQDKMSLAY